MKTPVALWTITRKEIIRWSRIWRQTLLPSVVTSLLYFLIFGSFIGERIGPMEGVSFMEFIVPGLVMMAIITNSYMNVVAGFYSTKFHGSVEEILVSPTPKWVIVLGYALGGVTRALVVGLLVTGVSLLFVPLCMESAGLVLLFALLTSLLFSVAGLINGMLAESWDAIGVIPTFVLQPLTYLGGVFYSITLLPPFWQALSRFNPVLYLVNGFRHGFLGISDIDVWLSLAVLAACCLLLFLAATLLLAKGAGLKE